jgi:hypothetical protein
MPWPPSANEFEDEVIEFAAFRTAFKFFARVAPGFRRTIRVSTPSSPLRLCLADAGPYRLRDHLIICWQSNARLRAA